MLGLIIACEIGFWVFVLGGLFFRYILRMKRIGAILLLLTPVVDLVLAVATVMDLRQGAVATTMHGVAAIYIGVSVAFGHRMIKWADERFAHRFAGGPKPKGKPKFGFEHAMYECKMWALHLLGCGIGVGMLYGMIYFVGDAARTESLMSIIQLWGVVLAIDFVWSFSYLIWPKKSKGERALKL
ncbi:hypothetical protein NV379_03150 [Paenibacillus sp. N1-5-1-14]|uniref:hypothetical protein n=1 Tax=Paenibacillus radicibacter TaxID=2972488 RepID=UPI0021598BC0|nr:hypothetical protein [Paenibacillus radicibacter]MCR8641644.1 hypothetical protein [Paenibacillus radicibacter]